jgi:hypothetical protein
MEIERRDFRVLTAAVVLLVVGVVGAIAAGAFFVHRHHEDVASLHRNPSYTYGYGLNVYNKTLNVATSARSGCQRYLVSHPAQFNGFSLPTAVEGCIDKWNASNS